MNVTTSKFCLEIADLYMQGDEAVKRVISSQDQNLRRDGASTAQGHSSTEFWCSVDICRRVKLNTYTFCWVVWESHNPNLTLSLKNRAIQWPWNKVHINNLKSWCRHLHQQGQGSNFALDWRSNITMIAIRAQHRVAAKEKSSSFPRSVLPRQCHSFWRRGEQVISWVW